MKRGRVKYDLIQTICHSFCHPLGGERIKIILKNKKTPYLRKITEVEQIFYQLN